MLGTNSRVFSVDFNSHNVLKLIGGTFVQIIYLNGCVYEQNISVDRRSNKKLDLPTLQIFPQFPEG